MGARNQYWVLAIVAQNAISSTIINHVWNYPLCFTIPCTQYIHLFSFTKRHYSEDKEFSQCKLCKESFNEYTYWCSHYHFNLHIRCAFSPLTMEAKVHDHPLTLIWMQIMFSCNFCGKEGNDVPYLCKWFLDSQKLCFFITQCQNCMSQPPLHLIHSLQVHQFDSPFCHLYVQNVDTNYMDFTLSLDAIPLSTSIMQRMSET